MFSHQNLKWKLHGIERCRPWLLACRTAAKLVDCEWMDQEGFEYGCVAKPHLKDHGWHWRWLQCMIMELHTIPLFCSPSWLLKLSCFHIAYLLSTLFRVLPLFSNNIGWQRIRGCSPLQTDHNVFPQVCDAFWVCPKRVALFHLMSNYYMSCLIKKLSGQQKGWLYLCVFVDAGH